MKREHARPALTHACIGVLELAADVGVRLGERARSQRLRAGFGAMLLDPSASALLRVLSL